MKDYNDFLIDYFDGDVWKLNCLGHICRMGEFTGADIYKYLKYIGTLRTSEIISFLFRNGYMIEPQERSQLYVTPKGEELYKEYETLYCNGGQER